MLISKFGTISKDAISEFEDIIGITLPKQYRLFIEKYNGGETPNTSFDINGVCSDIKGFYGLGKVKYPLDSIQVKEIQGKCYLPIAIDSFGNNVLIDLNEGKIYFSDHEGDVIKKIANDLKEFFNKCESKVINKSSIKSVEERERDLVARGRGSIITDELRDMWRVEIRKYVEIYQEEVVI